MRPVTVISNFKTLFSCYLYLTQYVYLIHIFSIPIFFAQFFLCGALFNRSSLILNLEFPFAIPKKLVTLACGKVCFPTTRNDVINSHKDRSGLFLCKKVG